MRYPPLYFSPTSPQTSPRPRRSTPLRHLPSHCRDLRRSTPRRRCLCLFEVGKQRIDSRRRVWRRHYVCCIYEALELRDGGSDYLGKGVSKETMMLKEQVQVLLRENSILKRAVAIQHEVQQEYTVRDQELQHLKQLVPQYQEQLKTLEMNNYALTMHLKQAQQSSSIPGHFHPDIF